MSLGHAAGRPFEYRRVGSALTAIAKSTSNQWAVSVSRADYKDAGEARPPSAIVAARQERQGVTHYRHLQRQRAFQRNKGMRLDFLLVNPQMQSLVTDAGVDALYRGRDKPSDHAPTWITIRSSPSQGT